MVAVRVYESRGPLWPVNAVYVCFGAKNDYMEDPSWYKREDLTYVNHTVETMYNVHSTYIAWTLGRLGGVEYYYLKKVDTV